LEQAGDDALAVEIQAMLGQARAAAGDYTAALDLLDTAIAIKLKERTGTRRAAGLAYSLACKAYVLGDRGRFAAAYVCFGEALDALRGVQHEVEGSVLCWRSAVHLWQGRWREGRADAVAAQRVAERTKTLYVFAMGHALAAYADWMVDRSPQSLQDLMVATSWLEARDKGLFISLNYGWLADALVTSARFEEARRNAAYALQRKRELDRLGEPMAYRALARMSAAGQGRKPAQHYLALAMSAAQARDSPHEVAVTELCQAEIASAAGEREQALACLDRATAAFEAMDMPWHLEQAGRLRAVL
jgi:tetratricopeptide (TPR) repeat protein